MRQLDKLRQVIQNNSRFLWLGTLIFIGSALLGYLNAETIASMAQELMKELEKIAEKIQKNGSVFYTFWVIFQNNVVASLTMLGLGVFFGIYPTLALVANGVLLGFLLKMFALKGVNPLSILIVGILPHGVIEIFAVVLAAAFGIKYGTLVFRLLGNLGNTDRRRGILDDFKDSLKELPFTVGAIVVLLFIAAMIESTITPVLIQIFIGELGQL
ncbi:stage II sporulation protein M [Ammoniphilus sp. CFH 90114]|uniref:stage II sporulation protein M n=1 Tax=Ammoniphilus sp. CFH 90114 TaxID=2493665 RepID=UPI00100F6121|nr:stage II sporulation protein M [Ammoniphilus sp. CFH 90114]RXT05326.1 stage II sporulation protein M [Ammoniphilus sp. CFH 90114]